MKPHRIFVAINLPEGVKKQLLEYKNTWPEFSASSTTGRDGPARWARKENLHFTLAFLGNTSEQELAEVVGLMQTVGDRHSPFESRIIRLQYGPDAKRPRMIWAIGERSPKLLALQEDVEHALAAENLYTPEKRPFSPHLTLARFNMAQFRQMEPEERPEIAEELSLSFKVESLELIESKLKRSGAEYTILQSFMLEKEV